MSFSPEISMSKSDILYSVTTISHWLIQQNRKQIRTKLKKNLKFSWQVTRSEVEESQFSSLIMCFFQGLRNARWIKVDAINNNWSFELWAMLCSILDAWIYWQSPFFLVTQFLQLWLEHFLHLDFLSSSSLINVKIVYFCEENKRVDIYLHTRKKINSVI